MTGQMGKPEGARLGNKYKMLKNYTDVIVSKIKKFPRGWPWLW